MHNTIIAHTRYLMPLVSSWEEMRAELLDVFPAADHEDLAPSREIYTGRGQESYLGSLSYHQAEDLSGADFHPLAMGA